MPKKPTPKKFLNVLGLIDVKKISIVECHSKLNLENVSDEPISVDSHNEVSFQSDAKSNSLAVSDRYQFRGVIKNKTIFDVNMEVLVLLSSKIPIDEQFMHLFLENTLKVITYPYVRYELQEATGKMGIAPLTLPMWRVPSSARPEYLQPSRPKRNNGA